MKRTRLFTIEDEFAEICYYPDPVGNLIIETLCNDSPVPQQSVIPLMQLDAEQRNYLKKINKSFQAVFLG